MGIFGELDADEIPDNPFWIAKGEYTAFISNAYFHWNEKREQEQLVICYKISDSDSKYYKREARDFFDVYRNLTREEWEAMSESEQAQIERSNGAIKRRLHGQPNKGYPGLGVDLADLDDSEWDPKESLVNKEVIIAIQNYGEEDEGVNVRYANLVE